MGTKERVDQLVDELNEHCYRYHVLSAPTISDADYDRLYRELEHLEHEHPEFVRPDSPTRRVGSSVAEGFKSIAHLTPMLSLNNAMDLEELLAFDQQVRRFLGKEGISKDAVEYCVEHKFDGVAISLVYEGGDLMRGITRGDGFAGEDITSNVRTIKSIPLKLRQKLPVESRLEVRGEILFLKSDFERLNEQRSKQGEPLFANPRNSASGSLRQLDPRVTAERPLKFYAYQLVTHEGVSSPGSHKAAVEWIEKLGFRVSPFTRLASGPDGLTAAYQQGLAERPTLPFEVDGLVVKVNDVELQKLLGFRQRSPRWAIAAKFEPVEEYTVLEDIVVQVGRTGVLTPVAILKPVRVGGVVVARATLHNEDEIERKDLLIGDTVVVRRQGDVIPAVVASVAAKRSGTERKFIFPLTCPVCAGEVEKREGDAAYRCTNVLCPAKSEQRILHYASRKAADIDGLGDKLVRLLFDHQLISDIASLYRLQMDELSELPRMGELSAKNLIQAIDRSRKVSLDRFIYALGIRHVGERTARLLAERFRELAAFREASYEELLEIPEIGSETAGAVEAFLGDEAEAAMLDRLLENGVVVEPLAAESSTGELAGKTFVITGTLSSLSRSEAQECVVSMSGKVSSSVSKKTDYLVAGDKPGSKLDKARELGVPVLDEEAFLDLVGRR